MIVAGSRHIDDYDLVCRAIQESGFTISEIVEGGARGADRLARRFAQEHGIECDTFEADWNRYGKKAGPLRNSEMAEYGDGCVAVPAPSSRGTWDMVKKARANYLTTYVHRELLK